VIQRRREDVVSKIREIAGGVDVVIDSVGRDTWPKDLKVLRKGGKLISVGATSGPETEVNVRYVFAKQISIIGAYMGSRAELMEVLRFIERGKLKPVIDSVLELEDAKIAHEKMERSEMFGKIVLRVG
ncbi:MAG: zinc-binding dehydrogenase, partial [Candidatus Korarchaeota archaeon]|nr:zinc-binding dehydrogenase [Candidatus Korarchaeota archaeon]